ncbi:MAG: DUF2520 domain-containing protein [Bdellovibrio sp.]|jgi:predicted short-subunit dehydrogenase-like oxidoreductase (DUF2520 family)
MTQYLVMGSGRWATHLQRLLFLSGVSHLSWNRKQQSDIDLQDKVARCSHVWLAVSDHAVPEWVQKLIPLNKTVLHSSGALEIEGAHSLHPLMSFRPELYDDDFYSRLAFVTTSVKNGQDLMPGLKNSLSVIPSDKKAFYHAMCVLAGNGSVLLWQKFFSEMTSLGIPASAASAYADRIHQNLMTDPQTALTGPLVRGDRMTLLKNLAALEGDSYQDVLQALIQSYHQSSRGAR